MRRPIRLLLVLVALATLLAACGDDASSDDAAPSDQATSSGEAGVRLVSAAEGGEIQADPPDGLVVLDVRTPEEYADGHLADALLIDIQSPDFAERLAELDPDVPYLLYCRSGNRSARAADMMRELGFSDVADVDGGIVAWDQAGLPIVTP